MLNYDQDQLCMTFFHYEKSWVKLQRKNKLLCQPSLSCFYFSALNLPLKHSVQCYNKITEHNFVILNFEDFQACIFCTLLQKVVDGYIFMVKRHNVVLCGDWWNTAFLYSDWLSCRPVQNCCTFSRVTHQSLDFLRRAQNLTLLSSVKFKWKIFFKFRVLLKNPNFTTYFEAFLHKKCSAIQHGIPIFRPCSPIL